MSNSNYAFGEMDLKDVPMGNKERKPLFLVMEPNSEHALRIISKPSVYHFQWVNDPSGKAHKLNVDPANDLVAAYTKQASKLGVLFLVLYRNKNGKNEIKVLDAGPQIFTQIRAISERMGPLKNYDIQIIRNRKGSVPLYQVIPTAVSSLSPDEIELIKAAKTPDTPSFIDLTKLIRPAAEDRVRSVILGETIEEAKAAIALSQRKNVTSDPILDDDDITAVSTTTAAPIPAAAPKTTSAALSAADEEFLDM